MPNSEIYQKYKNHKRYLAEREKRLEYQRKYYQEHHDERLEYKQKYDDEHADEIKQYYVNKKLKTLIKRKCPHCGGFTEVDPSKKSGICDCGSTYTVKHHLNRISIEGPFEKRNYEEEILSYIRTHKTCSREIIKNLSIAPGTVYTVLYRLKNKNIISVEPSKHNRIITLNNPGLIDVKTEWVEA
jgi:DNA-binding CsgD family transcriptional regulator